MRSYLIIMVVILFSALSCSESDDASDNPLTGDTERFQFYTNRSVAVGENDFAGISVGSSLVFEYTFTAEDNPDLADDEYAERILFQVDPELNSFIFTNEELISTNAYFDKFCFCLIEGSIPLEEGTISGERVNNETWNVTIDVAFTDFEEETRTITGSFRLTSP